MGSINEASGADQATAEQAPAAERAQTTYSLSDAPSTDAPSTDAPSTDAPSTDAPSTIAQLEAEVKAQRQAIKALAAERDFLRQIIDLNPDFMFAKDREGRFTLVNQAVAQAYGTTVGELIGKTDADFNANEEEVAHFRRIDQQVMDSLQEHVIPQEPITESAGRVRWLRTIKRPIVEESGVGLVANQLLGIATDITERRQVEMALEQQRAFLRQVIDLNPNFIFAKDRQGRFTLANKALADAYGVTVDEMIGKTDAYFNPNIAETEHFRRDDLEVINSGRDKFIPAEPITDSQGKRRWLQTVKRAIVGADGVANQLLGVATDITERKRLEEQIHYSLERRSRQVRLSTQIAQEIAAAADLKELYDRVVTQVQEQFGYYHTQILRYDPALDTVVLIVGYGEIGERMLAMHHSLPMGVGLIGTAAASGQSILRPNVAKDPHWRANPLLPRTKGELAVLIKLGNKVLGVLDVQSYQADALTEDDQLMLEGLCGQIAIAIESTRLRQEMESRLLELSTLQRHLRHEGWEHYQINKARAAGYEFDHAGVQPVTNPSLLPGIAGDKEPQTASVAGANGRPLAKGPGRPGEQGHLIQAPLAVRGEVIGALAVQVDGGRPLSPEEQTFLASVSEEVAEALESARLFEQTQDALAEQERLTAELETVARVSTAAATILDVDVLLQSVVDLTKSSFRLYHAHVYLIHDSGRRLVLTAGAGDVGRLMTLEGREISLEADSLVARAARSRRGVIENDVRKTVDFLPHPLLPQTRSELAMPMIVGTKVVGVLDLQSNQTDYFTQEDLQIHKTLAAQIAVAVENARQYEEQVETAVKLRQVDQLKSEFLASMSHELRTPLNSIIGFADVLLEGLDGQLNERMEEDVRLIRDSGGHLRELIGDILDMSKIESGRMELRYEEIDVCRMANDIKATAQPLAQEKSLALYLDIAGDVGVIRADRTRLRQILWNIMGNAIKFTPDGSITLSMQRQNNNLLISIRDTGIGIKPEDIPIVFEQFRQIDGGLNRASSGTGLGMPITKKLVELHGGKIWVESSSGQGSTFLFTIPYEPRLQKRQTAFLPSLE
jgi:PAS domain S-box-containing protein